MSESKAVTLEMVSTAGISDFQTMVEEYWQELMPHSPVIANIEDRQAFFRETFQWESDNRHPHWGIVDGRKIGFVSFEVSPAKKSASMHDFYISPNERRRGYGSAMVRALYDHFDKLKIELIELNVRRDNPPALAFWEAQGFRIASHRLRQYRDPHTGTGFIGALSSDFATNAEG